MHACVCACVRGVHAGGIFNLRITFSERYPDKPPRVRFVTQMFHPNIYSGEPPGEAKGRELVLAGDEPGRVWLQHACMHALTGAAQHESLRGARHAA